MMVKKRNECAFGVLAKTDKKYPNQLLILQKIPQKLWWKGDIGLLTREIIAVVGPRKPSAYVRTVMQRYVKKAMHYDHVSLSGGASGIDMMLHKGSFSGGIPTIVILGMGLRKALKGRKREFLERVVDEGGLILSEFPPNHPAAVWTYPQRNRLISALAKFVYVPGGCVDSGTEHTVKAAIKTNTPLYGAPGSLFEKGSGLTNYYIAQGSMRAVIDVDVLFQHFDLLKKKTLSVAKGSIGGENYTLTAFEERLLGLCKSLQSIEVLAKELKCPIHKVMASLGSLEVAGLVVESTPGHYLSLMD